MSSALYRDAVEKILLDGLFSGYDKLAEELGVPEGELRQGLSETKGEGLTTLVKFKILSLTGVRDSRTAIQIVESGEMRRANRGRFHRQRYRLGQVVRRPRIAEKSAGFIEDKELAAYLGTLVHARIFGAAKLKSAVASN